MIERLYNTWRMRQARAAGLAEVDRFLAQCRGVLHIGAHRGAERHRYGALGLKVLWVEADPNLFKTLTRNLRGYPAQKAVNALIADSDGQEVAFNVASNNGASSSMLAFAGHAQAFPGVTTSRTIPLKTRTIDSLMAEMQLDPGCYDALVLDVQGAELHVLRGMSETLYRFTWLKIEASDYMAYEGGAVLAEIEAFCGGAGFDLEGRYEFANSEGVGTYYDAVFRRREAT